MKKPTKRVFTFPELMTDKQAAIEVTELRNFLNSKLLNESAVNLLRTRKDGRIAATAGGHMYELLQYGEKEFFLRDFVGQVWKVKDKADAVTVLRADQRIGSILQAASTADYVSHLAKKGGR